MLKRWLQLLLQRRRRSLICSSRFRSFGTSWWWKMMRYRCWGSKVSRSSWSWVLLLILGPQSTMSSRCQIFHRIPAKIQLMSPQKITCSSLISPKSRASTAPRLIPWASKTASKGFPKWLIFLTLTNLLDLKKKRKCMNSWPRKSGKLRNWWPSTKPSSPI